jgi:hypothetical protein
MLNYWYIVYSYHWALERYSINNTFRKMGRPSCRSEHLMKRVSRHSDSHVLQTPFCVAADLTTVAHSTFKVGNRGGEHLLTTEDVKWTIEAGNCHFHLNNLFGGDKILGKTMVHVCTLLHRPLCYPLLYYLLLPYLFFLFFCLCGRRYSPECTAAYQGLL